MKVLGIDITGREIRIVALLKNDEGISDYTGNYKPIKLEDDLIAENVVLFKNTLFATLQSFEPDVIVVNGRNSNSKSRYAPSGITFKIEGLIQLFEKSYICITDPKTIAAYFKKHDLDMKPEFGYQSDALKLALHYIKTH